MESNSIKDNIVEGIKFCDEGIEELEHTSDEKMKRVYENLFRIRNSYVEMLKILEGK